MKLETGRGDYAMERFQYISTLEGGLDIKGAGDFVKEVIQSGSKVTVRNGNKRGDAKLIFNILSLNIKKGDCLEFTVEGENETEKALFLKEYVSEHL